MTLHTSTIAPRRPHRNDEPGFQELFGFRYLYAERMRQRVEHQFESYLQALVGERDSYLKTGGLAPLTNNQRYIQWRMLLLNGKGCTGAG